ncbi:hypothetical protein BUALT_Bualt01G0114100 [Buddleja alternifolia]|uniref:Myb/SANT-like domain-containing protein n=1 Tax=Buddleja alternifolia TaxID=168488 RepID=A0AAV6Y8M2_9LAMI|nr:hypothetical protein BUALT_Bualt01G0114100 [Buddleja alternifolia]
MAPSGSNTTKVGKKAVTSRQQWTKPEEDASVNALKDILVNGWKVDNGFKVGYLNVLQDKMMRAFPNTDLRAQPHISSRMHSWKKQYNTLYTIFGVEDFHDAMNGILHVETEPQSPMDINLEDIQTLYTPINDEEAMTSVCEPMCSSSTKHTKKGKKKAMDGIIGPIMEDINNFTDKTHSRLGEIVRKMGHEFELTRKCGAVFELIN